MFDRVSKGQIRRNPIDAVITWVDGANPAHRAKRQRYMRQAAAPLVENGVNPHRWESSDEIALCLQSIAANAPWLRRIWIVVDGDGPDLSSAPRSIRSRITIVDHQEIFRGFEDALPTFNSLAIESMLWRIKGLADRFLYFNDDVFLTAPLSPEDVFKHDAPVLRGKWVNLLDFTGSAASRANPALFNHFMQMNAALEAGFTLNRVFVAAHVVHPFNRPMMERLFAVRRHAFEANIRHKFRDLSQFSPQALHNHACLAAGRAVVSGQRDYLHLRAGCASGEAQEVLEQATTPKMRMLCVNDLPHLLTFAPDGREAIKRAIYSGQAISGPQVTSAAHPVSSIGAGS